MKIVNFIRILLVINFCVITAVGPKVVGLVQVKNEQIFIQQCLKALSLYTDAIVVLDDASTDDTVDIVKSLATECKIEVLIENKEWKEWNEPSNKNKLLQAARSIGGTHMVIIDADEMFSAECLKDNYLRNKILSLNPGDSMGLMWVNLWRSYKQYRDDGSVWVPRDIQRIFCDDGAAYYPDGFLHASSIPKGLKGVYYPGTDISRGILHFQFVNWENLLVKQAWYRCLEHIHDPRKSIGDINATYGQSKNERNIRFKKAKKTWFAYDFFDPSIFKESEKWRKKQVNEWFARYGKAFFKTLDIWDINWKE